MATSTPGADSRRCRPATRRFLTPRPLDRQDIRGRHESACDDQPNLPGIHERLRPDCRYRIHRVDRRAHGIWLLEGRRRDRSGRSPRAQGRLVDQCQTSHPVRPQACGRKHRLHRTAGLLGAGDRRCAIRAVGLPACRLRRVVGPTSPAHHRARLSPVRSRDWNFVMNGPDRRQPAEATSMMAMVLGGPRAARVASTGEHPSVAAPSQGPTRRAGGATSCPNIVTPRIRRSLTAESVGWRLPECDRNWR